MIGGPIAARDVGSTMIPSDAGKLSAAEVDALWQIFVEIARTWGADGSDPLYQRSGWLEFIHIKTEQDPSYLAEYRAGLEVLRELSDYYAASLWHLLFFEHGAVEGSRLAHLRKYVVEEFMQVWLTTGGFRTYGAGNYNSYVSGSRFAVRPPYRLLPTSPQAPTPQTSSLDIQER